MMDQAVFENNITKMKHRIEEGDIKKAIYIADKIDWSEVQDVNLLVYVSMIYEEYKDYDSAKAILEYAYEIAPIKNRLYFALCNINIKLGDLRRAQDFYIDFCSAFPLDNKKTLLQYYFLKKKGAEPVQKCRVLEEYLQEEKDEELMFELAVIYEELGEKEKVVSTCEYIVEFFGMKKDGYGRKALELKKKYEELTIKEEELIKNYLKENEIDEETNIVYQTISRPNLKIVEEKDNKEKIEKIKRNKKITEEELFKSEDDNMSRTIKYEPETIESLRDKEMNMAFMNKNKKQDTKEENEESAFEKYRLLSFRRKERNMKIEDLKQHMIIEAYSREEALEIAKEELAYLHKALGNEKKMAKASGYNINERGFSYYVEKLADRDLIIENAGQLKNQVIDEIEEYLIKNDKRNIIVLCDLINNFDKIAKDRPSFVSRFDIYSVLSDKKQDILDDEKDVIKTFENKDIKPEIVQNIKQEIEKEVEKELKEKYEKKEDAPVVRKVESTYDSYIKNDEYLAKKDELKKIEEEKIKKEEELKKLEELKMKEEIEAKIRKEQEEELKRQEEERLKREVEEELKKEEIRKKIEQEKQEELKRKIEEAKQEELRKQEEKLKKELEEKAKQEEELKKKIEQEQELKKQEEERLRKEAEEKLKKELEEKAKQEEELKKKLEEEKQKEIEKQEKAKQEEKLKEVEKELEDFKQEENKTKVEKHKVKDMTVDEFVEYCKSYAKSIDCNMPGKTIPALYERIEMMVEEGLSLTEKRAIELIESAADKAEKPRFFFKPKYDKDGNLILQEEHFIG